MILYPSTNSSVRAGRGPRYAVIVSTFRSGRPVTPTTNAAQFV